MGSLKRKEGPNGAPPSKSARPASESRPSKRAKASESTKDDSKKGANKQPKSPAKPAEASVVTKSREEEPLFPRGGGSILTPLEQKQISVQAKKDVLFEEQSTGQQPKGDKAARRKRRKSRADEKETKSSKDDDGVKVESLNFKVCQTSRGGRHGSSKQGGWRRLLTCCSAWSRVRSSSDPFALSMPSTSPLRSRTTSLAACP